MKLTITSSGKEKPGSLAFISGSTDGNSEVFENKQEALLADSPPRRSRKVYWVKAAAFFIVFILLVAAAVAGLLKYEIDQADKIHRGRHKPHHGHHHHMLQHHGHSPHDVTSHLRGHMPQHHGPGPHNVTSENNGHMTGDGPMRREHEAERLAWSRAEFRQRLQRHEQLLNNTLHARDGGRQPIARGHALPRERGHVHYPEVRAHPEPHFPPGYGRLHLPNGAKPNPNHESAGKTLAKKV